MVEVDNQSDLFIVQHTLDRFAIVVRCLGLAEVLACCHFANDKKGTHLIVEELHELSSPVSDKVIVEDG